MARTGPPHLNLVGSPTEGTRLGSYQLLERLGGGGMADVWKGTRQVGVGDSGKTVAIKVIATHAALNPDYQRMFLREAKVSLLLSHANIAQVFDVDLDAETNQLYMAMEYIPGLDLDQVIRRRQHDPLPFSMVGYITAEMLRGLTYAHEVEKDGETAAIVHRDISPHNIMISTSGEVKITDFGIASIASEATTGKVRGKLQYMPPEQLLGDSRNPTVDLFSVGAVLHELIEGKPFRAAIDAARMYGLILSGAKPELTRANVPSALLVLRDRLLEVDVAKRAPSARLALEYLYRWDGYRNTSLELGKLVKELLRQRTASPELGPGYSDTFDAPSGAGPPENVERPLEAQIETDHGSALIVSPESRVETESPSTPESRVPTEKATQKQSTPTLVATGAPPRVTVPASIPKAAAEPATVEENHPWAPVLVIAVLAVSVLAIVPSYVMSDEEPLDEGSPPAEPATPTPNPQPAIPNELPKPSPPAAPIPSAPIPAAPIPAAPIPATPIPSVLPSTTDAEATPSSASKVQRASLPKAKTKVTLKSTGYPWVQIRIGGTRGTTHELNRKVGGGIKTISLKPAKYSAEFKTDDEGQWTDLGKFSVPARSTVLVDLRKPGTLVVE